MKTVNKIIGHLKMINKEKKICTCQSLTMKRLKYRLFVNKLIRDFLKFTLKL